MRVGIIDADLIGRKKHRFPNLACMKLSAYHKAQGDAVELLTGFEVLGWDLIYVSKVFTDTEVPEEVLCAPNVVCGGTGFFYDKAPELPYEVEHSFPDYHLYDKWVEAKIQAGGKAKDYVYYTDYSIGFLTRGCFRKCEFCVNKKYDRCRAHSPLNEFMDPDRPKLCFLDDNFLACPQWEEIIRDVQDAGKRFQYKQGLDARLLTDRKIHSLMSWKYDGDFIFAFDNIADREIIEKKLSRMQELYPGSKKNMKFYVLCGYNNAGGCCDDSFFVSDIRDTFERVMILKKYHALPYIMRYKAVYGSRFEGMYADIGAWCNQPSFFRSMSFRRFCQLRGMGTHYGAYKNDPEAFLRDGHEKGAAWRYMEEFEKEYPEIAGEYFG